ncbi:MAG: M14 family zinc carboxypeptidase [Candidatus Neomarinimicrobiota bacterium]|nr:M14 family zinc carboxypeptidase [Candidatus Neomarinimicrobiota bacterium]MEE1572254.1 M14 family zinc carboxypeptidase [Candidatus Neomarinimicrobiota bacterium]
MSGLVAEERMVVRFVGPDKTVLTEFNETDYDIAAFKPGEFLDLVVSKSQYEELLTRGFRITVTQTEEQLKENLGEVRDLYGYRNYDELLEDLQEIESQYPDICKLYDIGNTRGKEYSMAGNSYYNDYNHEIWAMKVSDNVEEEEDEPSVFYMAEHHAREPISLEVNMYVLNHIISNYGSDPTITDEVNNKQIWFMPLVNPNGHKIVTDEVDLWWRKNIRDNNENGSINFGGGDGVDPNRNYAWNWGGEGSSGDTYSETYRGPSAFSEPEIQAMRDMLGSHHFVTGITYHSYSELVLFPFGYANNIQAPDHDALEELANEMAFTIPGQSGGYYDPMPSYELYPASGTTDDYAYGEYGVFSFTIELGTEFIPPASQIEGICEDNLEAALILLTRVNRKALTGHITDAESGDPVVAEIYIDGIDNTGEFRKPYESDLFFGRYYRLLQMGSYGVTFSALGYETQTINNVSISPLQQTVLDVELEPILMVPVTGQVTDGYTGAPIAQAQLTLSSDPDNLVYSDNSGYFSFPAVYEGTYIVHAEAGNYSTADIPVTITVDDYFIEMEMYTFYTESFESNEFSDEWNSNGNAQWYFDTESVYDGMYSVRSGEISHDQSSILNLNLNVTGYGQIGFHYRVASEYSTSGNYFYDGLVFSFDGTEMGQYQPTEDGGTPWTYASFSVSPGEHVFTWSYVKDGGDGSTYMEEDCAWIDVVEFPPTGDSEPPVDNVEFIVYSDWNMVGLPLNVEDSNYENLFPNSVTNTLFSFNGQYIQEENLAPGIGYWIRITDEGNVSISGQAINELSISLMEGWNLISGITTPVNVQNIIDLDGLIIPGTVYGFEDGYTETETMDPGYGYWLRSSGEGEITLSASATASRIRLLEPSEHLNALVFNNTTLYFGEGIPEEDKLKYSLPPKPPTGARDIRFSGNAKLCTTDDCVIEVMNNGSPLTFNCNIKDGKYWELVPVIANGTEWSAAIYLTGQNQITLSPEVEQWILRKSAQTVPETFALHPVYPNPFNPTTTLRFTVGITHASSLLQVFDITGRLVETLIDEHLKPGTHSVQWNASRFSSGVYFAHLESESFSQSQKIILLK